MALQMKFARQTESRAWVRLFDAGAIATHGGSPSHLVGDQQLPS
jgi:hypothetical protein